MSEKRNNKAFIVPAAIGVLACATLIIFGGVHNFGATPDDQCTAPTYEPDGRRWDELPPANVEQSSDDCIGFCFNAVVDGEERDGIARVVILEDAAVLTRGIVQRTKIWGNSDLDAAGGVPLRFACFTSIDDGGRAPRFEQCAQMTAFDPHAPGCETEPELVSEALPLDADDLFELW